MVQLYLVAQGRREDKMWSWLKSIDFPTGLEAWKVFIPAIFSAAAILVSVAIASAGWRKVEKAQRRESERRLVIEAATACGEAFDRLYDASQSFGRQAAALAAPKKVSMADAAPLLADAKNRMEEAYFQYRRSLVRVSAFTNLGDLTPLNPPSPNDALFEQFQQISWAANSIFSDDESERNAAVRSLRTDLRDDHDEQGFLGRYRSKLEQSLHKAILSK